MGSWGTGIKQSDAFADAYYEFFERYNEGGDPSEISKQLAGDFSEISKIAEEAHDFWLAIALAQWETKSLDKKVLSAVESIITSGADLKLWRDLGAEERDINRRKIALDKFLEQIRSERPKPKSRRKSKPKTPIYRTGDCIAFRLKNENYGGSVVIETDDHPKCGNNLVAITRLNQTGKPTLDDFKNAEILICNFNNIGFQNLAEIGWYIPDFHKDYAPQLELIGNLNVEFIYDNSNPCGKGYLFSESYSSGWDFAQMADLQFDSEKIKPKPEKTVTVKQLIKNGL
jgi:hypothetical protein